MSRLPVSPFASRVLRQLLLWGAVSAVAALLIGASSGATAVWQPAVVVLVLCIATGCSVTRRLAMYQFTGWIVAAFTVAMVYLTWFLRVGPWDLRHPWLILLIVQLVIFGMGTQMSVRDFAGVVRMPLFSMFGIAYFTVVTTAAGRDALLQIGVWLFLAAVLHNLLGYIFGYWLSRFSRMGRATARIIAIEVNLQNGGMASGLAGAMGNWERSDWQRQSSAPG